MKESTPARDDPLGDLEVLIRSRYSLIFLETEEEERAHRLSHPVSGAPSRKAISVRTLR